MITASQMAPGTTIDVEGEIFRVESVVKVSATKGTPFMKAKLRDLKSQKVVEKNFKLTQKLEELKPTEHLLEFLYTEERNFLFLDTETLDQVLVPHEILGDKADYLKEGIQVKAIFFGQTIYSVELMQFLELMVVKCDEKASTVDGNAMRLATLETGAKVLVPLFVESGDVIKVDTQIGEYIQRV